MVYFSTTDGHVWCLDALGAGVNSTQTTAYWVYPSISNPATAVAALTGPQDDPNNSPNPNAISGIVFFQSSEEKSRPGESRSESQNFKMAWNETGDDRLFSVLDADGTNTCRKAPSCNRGG